MGKRAERKKFNRLKALRQERNYYKLLSEKLEEKNKKLLDSHAYFVKKSSELEEEISDLHRRTRTLKIKREITRAMMEMIPDKDSFVKLMEEENTDKLLQELKSSHAISCFWLDNRPLMEWVLETRISVLLPRGYY